MNNIVNMFLRASIAASLSDREAFVDRVSKIIEDRTGKDPEAAHHLGDNIASAMDGLNEQLLLQQLLNPQSDQELSHQMEKLTEAVEKLTGTVDKLAAQVAALNPKDK